MRVGCMVECVDECNGRNILGVRVGKIIPKGSILTIRDLPSESGVLFEEVINGLNYSTNQEWCYMKFKFRELLPPIANIEEHINENTLEPVLT